MPYWIWTGMPGTWVEMTNRWYGKAMVASIGEWAGCGRKKAAPVNRIGAVSPAARSSPRMTPVIMPGSAWGRTILRMVCQRVAPSEMLTTRNDCGTARRASSAVLMMTGRVMMDRVSEAARMLVPNFRKRTNNSQTEQAIDNRGDASQVDDGDADDARPPVLGGIFGEVDGGSNSQWHHKQGSEES